MTIRVLRSKMRFAVRSKARLRKAGSRAVPGLLVELSLEGCRISNVNHTRLPWARSPASRSTAMRLWKDTYAGRMTVSSACASSIRFIPPRSIV